MKYINYLQIPYKFQGRDYKGCDCLGLVRLFYKEEFLVELPDTTDYSPEWFVRDAVKIIKSYSSFGFRKTKDIPQYGDILLINESNYPKHLGIVVNDGYFLHTTHSGTCCHRYDSGDYMLKIHSVYRYKSKVKSCVS